MRRPGRQQQASAIRRLNSRAWLVAIVLLLFHAPVTDFLGRVAEAADLHVAIGNIGTIAGPPAPPGRPPAPGSRSASPTSGATRAPAGSTAPGWPGTPGRTAGWTGPG